MMEFMSGAITMGFSIAGLFFFRFWSKSNDRLFLAFAVALWLLAINQAITGLTGVWQEEDTWVYLLRLAAFLLIIVAVASKNLPKRTS
ncbi:MAG: hypothetical protein K0Q70_1108 [Rhodospirillales bacterium]|nr:hypothetical protein [Rhodospirillales bacterium]